MFCHPFARYVRKLAVEMPASFDSERAAASVKVCLADPDYHREYVPYVSPGRVPGRSLHESAHKL